MLLTVSSRYEVAEWCDGEVTEDAGSWWVEVNANDKTVLFAGPGEWVVRFDDGRYETWNSEELLGSYSPVKFL